MTLLSLDFLEGIIAAVAIAAILTNILANGVWK